MIESLHHRVFTNGNKIGWTLLSNHGHVLLSIYRNPHSRLRDVAIEVGITERAVQKIVCELQAAGFLEIYKVSRNNAYGINCDAQMRHPLEHGKTIGSLLECLK